MNDWIILGTQSWLFKSWVSSWIFFKGHYTFWRTRQTELSARDNSRIDQWTEEWMPVVWRGTRLSVSSRCRNERDALANYVRIRRTRVLAQFSDKLGSNWNLSLVLYIKSLRSLWEFASFLLCGGYFDTATRGHSIFANGSFLILGFFFFNSQKVYRVIIIVCLRLFTGWI